MISPTLRPRLEFAVKAFLVVAFLGSLAAGALRLQQKALADEAHHVDLGAWSVVEKPGWATTDDVRAIRDATRLRGWHASLLHPGAAPVVWRSIELVPQVVRVAGMRKVYPDRFEAVLEVRRPVAAVRIGTAKSWRWIEVDETGVALSDMLTARPVRSGRPLREIVGAAGNVPRVGEPFGADVREAADLSTELDRFGTDDDRKLLAALDEIDVSNFGGRAKPGASEIVLRVSVAPVAPGTRAPKSTRCDLEWGRARAMDPYDSEPPFGAKATRVVQALRMFPGLNGLRSVKVGFEDLVVVPVSGSPLLPSKK
jgi:hypothetical protein